MSQKVSAIVCAYNEEKTIKPILEILLNHSRVDEVVVVDDGSKDKTWRMIFQLKDKKLVPLRHKQNRGKGAAVATAVTNAGGEILLFVDADLKRFCSAHVDLLLIPLEIDNGCMTIGLRESRRLLYKPIGTILRSFGGERAMRKKTIVPLLKRIASAGYGVEAIINLNQLRHRGQIYYIPLPGLIHKIKPDKHPVYQLAADYIKENTEILKQFLKPENKALEAFFKQIIKKIGS